MESSPPQEVGGQFYQALGDLKFSPTYGGLTQMGSLKIFTFWGVGCGEGDGTKNKRPKDKGQSLFTYIKLNSYFLSKIFFSEWYHDIKNTQIY